MADRSNLFPESYWVLPDRFLAGENPVRFDVDVTSRRLSALLDAGIDTFIDLTQPDELPVYLTLLQEMARVKDRTVSYQRFPILDRGLPSRKEMTTTLDALDEALSNGHKVYLHCWGGVGRTGTVVGCYLIRHGVTGQQALDQIAKWWLDMPKRHVYSRSPETDEQVRFILDWHESSGSLRNPRMKKKG